MLYHRILTLSTPTAHERITTGDDALIRPAAVDRQMGELHVARVLERDRRRFVLTDSMELSVGIRIGRISIRSQLGIVDGDRQDRLKLPDRTRCEGDGSTRAG